MCIQVICDKCGLPWIYSTSGYEPFCNCAEEVKRMKDFEAHYPKSVRHETACARCERLEKALREIVRKEEFVQMQDTEIGYREAARDMFWRIIPIAKKALEESDGSTTTTP